VNLLAANHGLAACPLSRTPIVLGGLQTYVKIGHGRDYAEVSPISGHYHGTRERRMIVEVKIKPVI